MKLTHLVAAALAGALCTPACQSTKSTTATPSTPTTATTATEAPAAEPPAAMEASKPGRGINLAYMDTSVAPGEDFFRYVNGKWLDETEIPADRERWGSFDELRKTTDAQTLSVLEQAAASGAYGADTDQGKAATFFALAMDTATRDAQGIAPIEDRLERIRGLKTYADVIAYEKSVLPKGGSSLLGFGIGSNPKNSNAKVIYFGGGSLGLPDRDYYLDTDTASVRRREMYVGHVARMLRYAGYTAGESKLAAPRVMEVETRIAESKLDKVARRDPYKRYNPRSLAQLQTEVPAVDWATFFTDNGLAAPDTVIVGEVAYLELLAEAMPSAADAKKGMGPASAKTGRFDMQSLRDYLTWQLIDGAANSLSTEIERANWEFYSQELRGAKQQRPREETAVASVNGVLGEAVGKLYVDEYFPAEAKAKAEEMVGNLIKAYAARIQQLEWMSPVTKGEALGKLATFRVKIGYPDEWKDYSTLEVKPASKGGTYLAAREAARQWNFEKDVREANDPVDKDEWFMSPQTVNAYYNSAYNEIVFPAAIMQPPFYDYQADAAVNYGGIGAVIGHEISHGFDDKGSQYDKDGNLKSWWTDADRTAFDARTGALSAQYSKYEPLPGVKVNGDFTLGENIGDLGGINAAYDALQIHLRENGHPGLIDGMTPEQRFFVSWGTIWRTKYRDKAIENQVKTDPHSPGEYRAIGPVLNLQSFYDAFGIEPGDAGYVAPEDRVVIW